MKKLPPSMKSAPPSKVIDAQIAELGDWRGETFAKLRAIIREAVPGVVEELKWGATPVWSHSGIICTGETYKKVVKMTFPKGASLKDPSRLFNSSLEGNVRRAIDFEEGAKIDKKALKALFQAAAALNDARPAKRSASPAKRSPSATKRTSPAAKRSLPGSTRSLPASKRAAPAAKRSAKR